MRIETECIVRHTYIPALMHTAASFTELIAYVCLMLLLEAAKSFSMGLVKAPKNGLSSQVSINATISPTPLRK